MNLSWYFDRSGSLHQAFVMIRDSILQFRFSVDVIEAKSTWSESSAVIFLCVLAGCAVIFAVSVLRERKIDVRGAILRQPAAVRFAVLLILVLSLAVFGNRPLSTGGFIYANF